MIGNSTPTSGLSPAALAFAATSRKEPEKAQEPTALAETKPEAVTASKKSGGYLASFDIENVLHLNSEPPIDLSTLKKGLSEKEWLGEAIKRSKAAYATTGEPATSLGSYTQKDLDTVKATTGCNVVVVGGLTCIVDDFGNPAPGEVSQKASFLLGDIESDRSGGYLTGELTPEYLKGEFAKYSDPKDPDTYHPFPEDWLQKALDFISKPDSLKSTSIDTRA